MNTRLMCGTDVLDRLGAGLDELHAATSTPVTARRLWLSTWAQCHPEFEPLALVVLGPGDRVDAAALLARRKRRMVTEMLALGHGLSDHIRLPARDGDAAVRLSQAVLDHLSEISGPWRLVIHHIPADDPVADMIAAKLPRARLVDGAVSPTLRFNAGRALRSYVSQNHHQQVRRMLNRMKREDLVPQIEHLRDPVAIAAVMPELEDVCRERDVLLRGRSHLDNTGPSAFFRQVILNHAARGEVELTTLSIKGELAAYVLCFLDGGVYRMWNCRLSPSWSRYGTGRVANNAALERALADPHGTEFDWMCGDEPYKMSMSNHVAHSRDLLAWSTPAVQAVFDARRRFKVLVKSTASRNDRLQRALFATKRLRALGQRRMRSALAAVRLIRE